jgi:hypothetical protein
MDCRAQWSNGAKAAARFALILCALSTTVSLEARPAAKKGPVAKYHFDEGSGAVVKDASGNHQNGVVVGEVKWVAGFAGSGLQFDGLSRISIPSSARLNLDGQVTITAWVRGRGSRFRLVREPASYPSLRAVYFQVCGDVLRFVSNSDRPVGWWDSNESYLFTGAVDVNLNHWQDHQQTRAPFTADEPKVQIVGDRAYYEYFGQDAEGVWQIWTAQSSLDAPKLEIQQRTQERNGYRVEQGSLQIAGTKIHYAWSQEDERDVWQTSLASSRLDGSGFGILRQTNEGAAFGVYQQVAGDKAYYLLSPSWGNPRHAGKKPYLNKMAIAVSDRRGGSLQILKTLDNVPAVGTGGVSFQVTDQTVYLAYIQADANDQVSLFTGTMRTDGTGFHTVPRNFGADVRGIPGVPQQAVKVIGNRVFYALTLVNTDMSAAEASKRLFKKDTIGNEGVSFWTAEARIDGSGWRATQRTVGPPDITSNYKSMVVVGGKMYYSLAEDRKYQEPWEPFSPYLATAGSNIVNKGDAYGLGLTESSEARAFVNAGEDYLFRGEAPVDVAGAIADTDVDEKWHAVAMTYDRKTLRLYLDGTLKSATPYRNKIGQNPFPVTIGDGFVGVIDEVAIYDRALSAEEVLAAGRRKSLGESGV